MAHKVIVTGAAGFIGSHLCESLLARDCHVVGVDCFTSNYDKRVKREHLKTLLGMKGFSLVEASLNDLDLDELLSGAAYVFHLAAQPGVRDSWHSRFDEYIDCNIRATHRLCEAARKVDLKRFVYASSSSVYGETAELPMGEQHPTKPVSPYGMTKLAGENLCLLYKQSFGLPVVALRFFTVFGPRQRPDMAFHRFIKHGLEGRSIPVYGTGEQTRDFTFVSDVVDANLSAMDYSGGTSVFNIGGGTRITLNSTIDILADLLPGHIDVQYEGPAVGDVTHTYADISLAQSELGYAPRVKIEEGIALEVDWVRALCRGLKSY